MKQVVAFAAALLLLVASRAVASAAPYTGHWSLSAGAGGAVQIRLQAERSDPDSHQSYDISRTVDLTALPELSRADLSGPPVRKHFTLREEAGLAICDGTVGSGGGSGTFVFAQNPAFRRALAQRGIAAPSDKQAFDLTMSGFRIATLDALLANGLKRPSLDDVTRLRDSGVSTDYLAGLNRLGYHFSADEVVRLHERGVSPEYLERLRARGTTGLSADAIIKMYESGS
jgi:hypothetical protein